MHPSRLDMLAVRHAPARAVVRCYDATTLGGDIIAFDLECGHVSHMAPHFDPRSVTHRNCACCGEAAVQSDPAYASEFRAACDAAIAAVETGLVASGAIDAPAMVAQPVQQQQANAGGMRYAPAIVTDAPETLDNLPAGQWIAYGTARGRYMGRKGGCVWIAWGRTASRRFPAFAEAFRA